MNLPDTANEVVRMLATPDVKSWRVGERGARLLVYGRSVAEVLETVGYVRDALGALSARGHLMYVAGSDGLGHVATIRVTVCGQIPDSKGRRS